MVHFKRVLGTYYCVHSLNVFRVKIDPNTYLYSGGGCGGRGGGRGGSGNVLLNRDVFSMSQLNILNISYVQYIHSL